MCERPFNHPFNFESCVKRLYSDYVKHNSLIVAFDFDNTIWDYHACGGDMQCVVDLLAECSDLDFTMILFTANEGEEKLTYCKAFCESQGIKVDYINESPIMATRKPYYNILLDDRAGLEEAYYTLSAVVNIIKMQMSYDD